MLFRSFGADDRTALRQVLLITDGAALPPGNHLVPPDGLHGVTVLDLPSHWDELDDASRLRLTLDGPVGEDGRVPLTAVRLREEPVRARGDQCDLATAEALARRLTPLHTGSTGAQDVAAPGEIATPGDYMELLGLGDVRRLDPDDGWRPRPARDRPGLSLCCARSRGLPPRPCGRGRGARRPEADPRPALGAGGRCRLQIGRAHV